MTVGFSYQPRFTDIFDKLDVFGQSKSLVIALMEKRDRELEDYLSQTVNASLDARVTTTENTNTAQTTQINTLNALFAPGVVFPYAGTTAPAGYFLCDGGAISRTTYAALFAIIGTTYGAGDGSTTFNVPDMRQRFPLGKATAGTGSTLGGTGGTIDHTHSTDPAATTSGAPSATVAVQSGAGTTVATDTHTHSTNIAPTVSDAQNPPFLSLNFIIKT